ncbi:hypothetical protein SAMN05444392_101368 [Seinonella peptonophila]|uniref:Uncharacterized protein n=1 Tax=Seinonella peptonophila TaxID=112248 RepID=A0A1M4T9T1_9BACL|nr:hypothetical protein [Seinonella peptonophila]SHE40997.1 hypothetical protein SAMN05444392_101368 [Seinonella peptonophila]
MKKVSIGLLLLLFSLIFSGCGLFKMAGLIDDNGNGGNGGNGTNNNQLVPNNNQTQNNQNNQTTNNQTPSTTQGGSTLSIPDSPDIKKMSFGTYSQFAEFSNVRSTFHTGEQFGFIYHLDTGKTLNVTKVKIKIYNSETKTQVYSDYIDVKPEWKGLQGDVFRNATENNLLPGRYTATITTVDDNMLAYGEFIIN